MDEEKHPVCIRQIKIDEKRAKVMIQNVRLAFVSLAEPNTKYGKKDAKDNVISGHYQCTALIPKSNKQFVEDFKKIIESLIRLNGALTAAEKKEIFKIATSINVDGGILKDGDKRLNSEEKPYDGLPGNLTLRAKTEAQLVDNKWVTKVPINIKRLDKSIMRKDEIQNEMYSGVYADLILTLVPYKTGLSKGVTVYLGDAMKLCDGPRLGMVDNFDDRSADFDDIPETTSNEF